MYERDASILQNLPTTERNYPRAIQLLRDRFENTRTIVRQQLTAIINENPVTNEDLDKIRRLKDNFETHIHILETLGCERDEDDHAWGPQLVIQLLLDKLDRETRKVRDDQHPGNGLHNLDDMFRFLELRIQTLEQYPVHFQKMQQSSKRNKFDKKRENPRTDLGSGNGSQIPDQKKKCICCSSNDYHSLTQCPKFKGKSVGERGSFARDNKCCYNCLSPNHFTKDCSSNFRCRDCKGTHHSLLQENRNTNTNTNKGRTNLGFGSTQQEDDNEEGNTGVYTNLVRSRTHVGFHNQESAHPKFLIQVQVSRF